MKKSETGTWILETEAAGQDHLYSISLVCHRHHTYTPRRKLTKLDLPLRTNFPSTESGRNIYSIIRKFLSDEEHLLMTRLITPNHVILLDLSSIFPSLYNHFISTWLNLPTVTWSKKPDSGCWTTPETTPNNNNNNNNNTATISAITALDDTVSTLVE